MVSLQLRAFATSPAASPPLVARRWLEQLSGFTGALPQVQALLAQALLLNGDLAAAQSKAADLLQRDPQDAGAHVLACSIALAQERPQQALVALELAVSADFAVRETPMYHIVQARALMAGGRLEEAQRVLEAAMALPGVKAQLTPAQRQRLGRRLAEPSTSERASIYLLLAQVLQRLSAKPDAPEAKKVGCRPALEDQSGACPGKGAAVPTAVGMHPVSSCIAAIAAAITAAATTDHLPSIYPPRSTSAMRCASSAAPARRCAPLWPTASWP